MKFVDNIDLDFPSINSTNILITGGCGFIGSNFIAYLLERYPHIHIVNIDKLSYCSTRDLLENTKRYTFVCTDINHYDTVKFLLIQYNIDTVVHFAAQSHVDNSFKNSIEFTYANVLGTHTLLEACREYGKLNRFIHISTDETYGEIAKDDPQCAETKTLNPTNPYAATKASAEHLVRSYYFSFGLPTIITRGNNVYGPRQYPEKLIPAFTTQLLKGEKCNIHGKGESMRNFIHVSDVCRAIETIMLRGKVNEIYNIGTKDEFTVLQILRKLVDLIKGEDINHMDWGTFVEDRLFNDFRYAIDCTKLRQLGWSEKIPFDKGIKMTIEWYKDNLNFFNPKQ